MNKDEEIARLKEAFTLFEETSRSLESAYEELQNEVRLLTAKLEQAECAKQEEETKNKVLLRFLDKKTSGFTVG